MDVGKATVTDVLGGNKKVFIIPLYQRNYSWGKKQCLKLFTDIISIVKFDNIKDYFLGTIVYAQHKAKMNYSELTLIDGQQRLTSISLLLKAISKKMEAAGEEDTNEIDSSYLKNKKAAIEEYGYVLKLKPNNKDNITYSEIMEDKDVTDKTSNLYLNYMAFFDWLDKKNEGLTYAEIFSCIERVKLVYITLEKDDDPQLVFETINSTGQDLMFSDLIRNCVLTNEKSDVQNHLYMNYWRPLEELLDTKVENFIRPYLQIKVGQVFPKAETYNQFRNFYVPNKDNADEVLSEMLEYAEIYNKIETGMLDTKKFGRMGLIFKDLDYTLTYPFVLQLLHENKRGNVTDEEAKNILDVLCSFIFRKTVMRINLTQQFASLMVSMYGRISNSSHKDQSFILNMLENENEKLKFTTDEEFAEQLKTRDIYNSKFVGYLLRTIEDTRSKEMTDYANVSVDHIMPQKPDAKWLARIKDRDAYNDNLHRLGNLTLTAYNSEKQNKVRDVFSTSKILLNKGIDIETWDIRDITNRSNELAQECCTIWRYPDTSKIQVTANKDIIYINLDNLDTEEIENDTQPTRLRIADMEWPVLSWEELIDAVIAYVKDSYPDQESLISRYTRNGDISLSDMKELVYNLDESLDVDIALL